MITPDAQYIPGQTPITDPLQLQFLTSGQMGYMPQAQFMTPSELGAFRTMPVPDVNGYVPQTDSLWQRFLIATKGGPFGLPEYTFNTYNPAISVAQQQVYAHRNMHDAAMAVPGIAANLGAGTALTALFGLPGMAASLFLPDMTAPVTDRIRESRMIQNMTTAKVYGSQDTDTTLGYGFNYKSARNLDRMMRYSAADDSIMKEGDWREMLRLGIEYGQFDYANNVEQYKRVLKNLRNSMTTMMEVVGSTDFKDIMKTMKRMQDMGATAEQYNNIARQEQAYARMTGLSHQQMVDTYGASGALTFQQAGLNAMQGSLQSMANAANITYMQRTGVLDPVTLAHYGGVSGMAQRMTQQDARVHNSFADVILPGLMNDSMTGLRTDVDLFQALGDPNSLQKLMSQGNRIYSGEQMMAYEANKHHVYTQLQERFGADNLEILMATRAGQMAGFQGREATRAGLMMTGMDAETATFKTEGYYSEAAQKARARTMDEARQKRREEYAQRNSWLRRLTRSFETWKTGIGERLYGVSERLIGNSARNEADAAGRAIPLVQPASDFGRLNEGLSRTADIGEFMPLYNKAKLTDRDTEILFAQLEHGQMSETSRTGAAAMARVSNGGFGAFSLTSGNLINLLYGDGKTPGKWNKYKDLFESHASREDLKLLRKYNDKTDAQILAAGGKEEFERFKAARERATQGWGALIQQQGFLGDYGTEIKDIALPSFQKRAKTDARYAALSESPELMAAIFPMGVQMGGGGVMTAIDRALQGVSAEQIRASVAKDGGIDIINKLYNSAQQNKKTGGRYRIGGDDYNRLMDYVRRLRSQQGGFGDSLSRFAHGFLEDVDFKGKYGNDDVASKRDGSRRVRPDCSGLVHEVVKRYVEENGGVTIDNADVSQLFKSDSIETASEIYRRVAGAAGESISMETDNVNDAVAAFMKNVRAGTLIAVDNNGGKNNDRYRSIDHIGMVIERDGKKYVLHQGSKGATEVALEDFIRNQISWRRQHGGGKTGLYATDLNKLLKGSPSGTPLVTRSERIARLRAADRQADTMATNLLNTKIEDGGADTVGMALRYNSIELAAKDQNYKVEGVISAAMANAVGGGIENVTGDELASEVQKYSGSITSLSGLFATGKNADAVNGNNAYERILSSLLLQKGYAPDNEAARRAMAKKLLQNTAVRRALQVSVVRAQGEDGPLVGIGKKYEPVITGKVTNDVISKINKTIAANLVNRQMNGMVAGSESKISDAYIAAVSDQTAVKGGNGELTAGMFFENMPTAFQFLADYKALTPMLGDKTLSEKERKEIESQREQLKKHLMEWGTSLGYSKTEIENALKSGGNAQATMESLLTRRGIKLDGSKKELLTRLGKTVELTSADADDVYGSLGDRINMRLRNSAGTSLNSSTSRLMRNTGNVNEALNTRLFLAKSMGAESADEINFLHDKRKIDDERFNQMMSALRRSGYDKAADYIEERRRSGQSVDLVRVRELTGRASPLNGATGNPLTDTLLGDQAAADYAKLNQALLGGGIGGGANTGASLLSKETDQALGELPGVLKRVDQTLTTLNATLKKNNRDANSGA